MKNAVTMLCIAFLICFCHNAFSQNRILKEDITEIQSNPLMLLTTATLNTPLGSRLRSDGTTTDPVFIIFEGSQSIFECEPTTPMKKRFEINPKSGKLEKVFTAPLITADSNIRGNSFNNAYIVQERDLADNPTWVLNKIVTEVTTSSLTYLEAQTLLSAKYGWELTSGVPLPYFCDCSNKIVLPKIDHPVTVRELIHHILRLAAKDAYAKSSSLNWVVIYRVAPAGFSHFSISQLVTHN